MDDDYQYDGGEVILAVAGGCTCCILPFTLAMILSFAGGALSNAATDVRNMPTIVPPANETFQLAILPDHSILLPNGT